MPNKKKKRDISSPYSEYKKQPSQKNKKYIQLSLPLNHGVNEV